MASPTGADSVTQLAGVKNIVLVMSGKGGVGKSTVATQMALALQARGNKVGLLDLDLCGPSVPRMLNVDAQDVHSCADGWVPVFLDKSQNLAVMSIQFLLKNKDDAVVWRGPKKNSMIKQFVEGVCWGPLDYLVVDTPPGTSDEHITVVECIKKHIAAASDAGGSGVCGVVLVTTPQAVAVADVRREVTFCVKAGLRVLGLVENMSGYVCPHCSTCTNIFSRGGGRSLASLAKLPFLGSIPIDGQIAQCLDNGENFVERFAGSQASISMARIVDNLVLGRSELCSDDQQPSGTSTADQRPVAVP